MRMQYTIAIAATLLALQIEAASPPDTSRLDCFIEPSKRIELAAAVSGILESVEVERGDRVRKGQRVAYLNSGVERANVLLAEQRAKSELGIASQQERLDLAKRSLERIGTLHQSNMVSAKDEDETKTAVRLAQLDLQIEQENKRIAELEHARALEILNLREIVSPVDGFVVDRFKSTGEFVEEQPILAVAQVNPLHVEVIAPVEFYREIAVGMEATVYPEEPIGGEVAATVITVDPVVDGASGTFRIRLEMGNAENSIPAGISCRAEIR